MLPTERSFVERPVAEMDEMVSGNDSEQRNVNVVAAKAGHVVRASEAAKGLGDEFRESRSATDVDPRETPSWSSLPLIQRKAVVEALFFASERPLSLKDLRQLLNADRKSVKEVIDALRQDCVEANRGVTLEEVGGGFAYRTRLEFSPWVRAIVQTRPPRLSRAALETLAIVAYRQPVTRAEVEEVRGVETGSVLRSLLDKRLVRILGRKDDIGRPMIYATTREFLELFGLKDLTALPTLRDFEALSGGGARPKPVKDAPRNKRALSSAERSLSHGPTLVSTPGNGETLQPTHQSERR